MGAANEQDHAEDPERCEQRDRHDVAAVGDPDHHQRDEVVDDRDGEYEGTQPVGQARPDQGEHAEGKRRVRRHRRAPSARRGAAGVRGEVDRDGYHHPAEAGHHRERQPPPLPQLTHVELTASFKPDDEEEERHQPAVHPAAQIL
jgi:hypothetical protein